MGIFDINGPLMSALRKLADLILLNIVFVITCLPIFTIGASLTALYAATFHIVRDEDDGLVFFREFFKAFKKNFGRATLTWVLSLAAAGFLWLFHWVTGQLGGGMGRMYSVTFYVLALLALLGYQYLFPMLSQFDWKVFQNVKRSYLTAVANLPWTLATVAVTLFAVGFSFLVNGTIFYVAIFIWMLGGFSILAYINTFFFRMVFQKIKPESAEPEYHPEEHPLDSLEQRVQARNQKGK